MTTNYFSKIYKAITTRLNAQRENSTLEQEVQFYRNLSKRAKSEGRNEFSHRRKAPYLPGHSIGVNDHACYD